MPDEDTYDDGCCAACCGHPYAVYGRNLHCTDEDGQATLRRLEKLDADRKPTADELRPQTKRGRIATMHRIRFYVGLDAVLNPPTGDGWSEEHAAAMALNLALRHFPDGATVYPALGGWRGPEGTETEPSLVVEVLAEDNEAQTVKALAVTLRNTFCQQTVLVTNEPIPVPDFV